MTQPAHADPRPAGEGQLRQGGRALLLAFYTALRSLKLYPVENATVQKALDDLDATAHHPHGRQPHRPVLVLQALLHEGHRRRGAQLRQCLDRGQPDRRIRVSDRLAQSRHRLDELEPPAQGHHRRQRLGLGGAEDAQHFGRVRLRQAVGDPLQQRPERGRRQRGNPGQHRLERGGAELAQDLGDRGLAREGRHFIDRLHQLAHDRRLAQLGHEAVQPRGVRRGQPG